MFFLSRFIIPYPVIHDIQHVIDFIHIWAFYSYMGKKHTSISLCVIVFLIEALLADIPNPQLFQNKIFIDKLF